MKLSLALPPGFTILGTLAVGALLWIGAQLPGVVFAFLAKQGPALIQAASTAAG